MRRRIVGMILMVVTSVVISETATCLEKNGLGFVVNTDKKVYKIGEPIRVGFSWTNVTESNLVIVNWRGPKGGVSASGDDPDRTYDFSVFYEGKERLDYHGEYIDGPRSSLTLKPRQTETREYEITDVYSFSRPGRYVIRVTYNGFAYDEKNPARWRGKIDHPAIEIAVRE